MSLTDRFVHKDAAYARTLLPFYIPSVPINQAGIVYGEIRPFLGYPTGQPPYAVAGWYIDEVQWFSTARVATVNFDVLITNPQNTAFTTAVGAAGAVIFGTVAVSNPARRGNFNQGVAIRMTTDGTGTVTNFMVIVTIRPYPLDNEAA